ncbi:hypothetical protein DID88_003083 [Monilinia fructigena]|uniref:Uncharacterized protein n=1 Tax=Monilinia fructigena TaxID=38457 RepID=A0A395IUB5_9HELO|nr:hypothetical protein DID88_003083 [Monilinia fructigena]
MSFKEHVGVSAIFSTGLLACIASMGRNEPSILRVDRRGMENYSVLDGSQDQHDAFSTTSLGNVPMAKETGNGRDNLEMVPVDEEMGILKSVRI